MMVLVSIIMFAMDRLVVEQRKAEARDERR